VLSGHQRGAREGAQAGEGDKELRAHVVGVDDIVATDVGHEFKDVAQAQHVAIVAQAVDGDALLLELLVKRRALAVDDKELDLMVSIDETWQQGRNDGFGTASAQARDDVE